MARGSNADYTKVRKSGSLCVMCFVISFFISEELTGEIYWPNYLLSHCEDERCRQDHVDEHNHLL